MKCASIRMRSILWAGVLVAVTLTSEAALHERPGGMVYDDVQDITWLQDWDMDGLMDWDTANDWANNLVYGGYSDWRLPTSVNADGSEPCLGFSCAGSEMGYIFYQYVGGKAFESILDPTGDTADEIANLALFTNVRSFAYWSGTEYAPDPNVAWLFYTNVGQQVNFVVKASAVNAVAVRAGDVSAVPEPETVALMVVGLGALGLVARRR